MRSKTRALGVLTIALATVALAVPSQSFADNTGGTAAPQRGLYRVTGADTVAERTAVNDSGVDVLGVRARTMDIVADPAQARRLRADGYTLTLRGDFAKLLKQRSAGTRVKANDFPPGDEGYHTYAEATAELQQTQADHPAIAKLSSIGKSYQGRALNVLKISDNVGTDENEPEVLFDCNQHAREHLTTEMCLHIVQRYTDGYATDPAIKRVVDTHEIWVIPNMNPDGSEYDISGGQYHGWRKNRQPNSGGTTGTDENRNWGYKWGCCGGSSSSPSSETYRGTAAFSTPETRAVANFVNSRVVGGQQQIKANIDFHTYAELVLWPFGFTTARTTTGMTDAQATRFENLGRQMAASNGYTPEQSSKLYITDGDINDWLWAQHKILSYTFEMYPSGSSGLSGFYPPASVIGRETTRNDGAVDALLAATG